jgi:tetratricopeptide (TPR) repeat protein
MQLKLKYNEHAANHSAGAFIRGNSPGEWLAAISEWNIDPQQLQCFIISRNNDPQKAAGLFVIFRSNPPALSSLPHGYTLIGSKLFIPVDAELSPQVSDNDLKSILIWDFQVLHPVLGCTGFYKSDEVQLAEMIEYPQPQTGHWNYAEEGLQPAPRLRQITIHQPTPEEVFEEVKDEVNSKDITEIPKEGKDTPLSRALDSLARGGLRGGLFLAGSFIKAFGSSSGSSNKPGLINRLESKMQEKLKDLEAKRNRELQRLMKMFDDDTDEALRYAIPLDSPYLGRGEDRSPGWQLNRNPLDFNLGRLGGGGGAVSYWSVDEYYFTLRKKYQEAAEKAIAAKNYKKAAYVYAHLLHDFHAAAGALEQGGYYREAAALYKDHLKNIPAAAECLERGGLLLEAIKLYEGLQKHEKAGDLYTILEQEDKAYQHYKICVSDAIKAKDFIDAARLAKDKMKSASDAKNLLLKGWNDAKQPEACLTRYFKIIEEEDHKALPQSVRAFYVQQPAAKRASFLNVLLSLKKTNHELPFENTARDIAYEVISEQVSQGTTSSLVVLKNFVSGDQLISGDCHRYISTNKNKVRVPQSGVGFKLYKDVKWFQAIPWRQQFLVVGLQASGFCIARVNWNNKRDYHLWNAPIISGSQITIAPDADHSKYLVLHTPAALLNSRTIEADNDFPDFVHVLCPSWLPKGLIGLAAGRNGISVVHTQRNTTYISHHAKEDHVKSSNELMLEGKPFHIPLDAVNKSQQMIFRDGFYYLFVGPRLLRITPEGVVEMYLFDAPIRMLVATDHFTRLKIAVHTDKGCMLLFPGATDIKIGNDYFAADVEVTDLKFIPDSKLLVAGGNVVEVFAAKGSSPKSICAIETRNKIIGVLPGPERNQIVIIEEDGKVTRQEIEES